jgi:hypothetical protein
MKKIILLLILAISVVSFAQIPMRVAPLKIGNFWKYWDKGYKKTINTLWYKSYRVVDTATINSTQYYKILLKTNTDISYIYCRLNDSGYYAAYQAGENEYIYYKKNAQYHDIWQQHYWNANNGILYSCITDTGVINIYGRDYYCKLLENTDSCLATNGEIWTEEVGLINFRVELSEYELIGWCIDGEPHGDTTLTAINDISPAIKKFELYQNYPNPFNPVTNISYTIPHRGFVQLKVYDMLGRQVAELINEAKDAGEYTIRFNGKSLSSGIYYYQLKSEGHVACKKFILLK